MLQGAAQAKVGMTFVRKIERPDEHKHVNQRLHFSAQKWIKIAPVERAGFSWRFHVPFCHIDQRKFGVLKFCELEHGQNDLIKKNLKARVIKFLLHYRSEPQSTSRRYLILSNMVILECPNQRQFCCLPIFHQNSTYLTYPSTVVYLYNDIRTLFSYFLENYHVYTFTTDFLVLNKQS